MKLWITLAFALTLAGCGALQDVFWDSKLDQEPKTVIV